MKDWAAQTPRHRSEVLRKAWELMTARLPEFAHLITLENGKAKADAMGEATYAAEFFRWFAEEAVRAEREGNFERSVKALLKLPTEFDGVNDAVKTLKAKEERGVKPAEAKRIAKELEELAARQKELEETQAELLNLELKTA